MEINKQKFIDWLQIKGLSQKTISDYSGYFDKIEMHKISPDYFMSWLKKHHHGPARAMLKNLIVFLITNFDTPQETRIWLSSFNIPKITGHKKERVLKLLTREQVHQLAKGMNKRDRFMCLLTFYLGLRSAELLSLRIDNFDWQKNKVKFIGKGNKERILPLIPALRDRLIDYINGEIDKDPDFTILFPVSPRYWRQILSKKSKKILGFHVNPHRLRHSCGSYLHDQGLSLKEIADYLGHKDIKTTQIYVHINKKRLDERILNAFS